MSGKIAVSQTLFVTSEGESLKFYIRPCAERLKLRDVIEERGGTILNTPEPSCYRLALPDDHVPLVPKNNLKVKFIYDCVAANKLLPLEAYLFKTHDEDDLDINKIEDDYVVFRGTTMRNTSSKSYSTSEDKKIIKYVIGKRGYSEVKGRAFWVEMENDVFKDKRTWQSLKERYLKRIVPKLKDYNVSFKYYELMRKGCRMWSRADQTKKERRKNAPVVVIEDSEESNETVSDVYDDSNDTVFSEPRDEPSETNKKETPNSRTAFERTQKSVTQNPTTSTSNESNSNFLQCRSRGAESSPSTSQKPAKRFFEGIKRVRVMSNTPNLSNLSSRLTRSKGTGDPIAVDKDFLKCIEGSKHCTKRSDPSEEASPAKKTKTTESPAKAIPKDHNDDLTSTPSNREDDEDMQMADSDVPSKSLTPVLVAEVHDLTASDESNQGSATASGNSDLGKLHLSLSSCSTQQESEETLQNVLTRKHRKIPFLTSSEESNDVELAQSISGEQQDSDVIVETEDLLRHAKRVMDSLKDNVSGQINNSSCSVGSKSDDLDSFDEELLERSREVNPCSVEEEVVLVPNIASQSETFGPSLGESLTAAHLLDTMQFSDEEIESTPVHKTVDDNQCSLRQESSPEQEKRNPEVTGSAIDPQSSAKKDSNSSQTETNDASDNIVTVMNGDLQTAVSLMMSFESGECKTHSLLPVNSKDILISGKKYESVCSLLTKFKFGWDKFYSDKTSRSAMNQRLISLTENDTEFFKIYN